MRRPLHDENGLPSINLELNLGKCGVHGAAEVQQELGIRHMRQGVMAVSMLLGAPGYVHTKQQHKAEEVRCLVETLMTLCQRR